MYCARLLTILIPVLLLLGAPHASALPQPVCSPDEICLENPLSTDDPHILIGRIIRAMLGIVGSLALALFTYGGFLWMTSAGNEEKVKRARNTLVWGTVGLVVIFSGYAVI